MTDSKPYNHLEVLGLEAIKPYVPPSQPIGSFPNPIVINYSYNKDGYTFALGDRTLFPNSRGRLFIGTDSEYFSEADKQAIVKVLTGIYDNEPVAIFVHIPIAP